MLFSTFFTNDHNFVRAFLYMNVYVYQNVLYDSLYLMLTSIILF